jgi:hypothetical protein
MDELTREDARELARKGAHELARRAGRKAVITKGPVECRRISLMANWTMKHGKNDAENPYSKENYYRDRPGHPHLRQEPSEGAADGAL